MKYWIKLTFASKTVFILWTMCALYMLFSGESGVGFIQWLIIWLFGCLLFAGGSQIISTRKKNKTDNHAQIAQSSAPEHLGFACETQATKNYDSMDGHQFEYFCADIVKKNGFSNVEVTQGSGDHGIDILAEKDGITYAIQCKCYSSNIGNAAVQQAHTGKSLYRKDIAVVLTNRYFTPQAKEEAQALGVKLWDRDKLNDMIEKSNS